MKISDLIDTTKKASSMRAGFLLCVTGAVVGGISLSILDIIFNQGKNLLAIAAIIAAYLSPAFYGKKEQKKTESPDEKLCQ